MNNVASVKDRLKNKSKETGKTMLEMLVAYGLERTIYRISVSRYADHFTLKGGIFLYAILGGDFARATTDIDLLAERTANDVEAMKQVFAEVFSLDVDDPIHFDMNTLSVTAITEFKEYHGVNVSIQGLLDRTCIPISIDIGFGDVVYPERVRLEFPVVLGDESPVIYAYSIASCVAEKFEAIVSLGEDNSRFKDFYDLYVLSQKYDFNGAELREAVKETFAHRKTTLDSIVAFEPGFSEEPIRISRWNAFVKKKKAMLTVPLEEVIQTLQGFLSPIVESIEGESEFRLDWTHEKQKWI